MKRSLNALDGHINFILIPSNPKSSPRAAHIFLGVNNWTLIAGRNMSEEKAQLYDEDSNFQYRNGMSLMDEHLKPKSGDCILDLGCGTGRLAAQLASKVGEEGKIVAVDPNAQRVQLARRNVQRQHDNIQFVVGTVDDAVILGPFDGIFCNFVLHWVPDGGILETLKTALDCLKPGGELCAQMTVSPGALYEDIVRLVTAHDTPQTQKSIPGQAGIYWRNLCKSVGFDVLVAAEESPMVVMDNLYSCVTTVIAYTEADVNLKAVAADNGEFSALMKAHNINSRTDKVVVRDATYVMLIARKPADL
eukprot:scpid96818/ scgid10217/ Malonyl-CoA O-methyltransferase BioC; Biotin synthesis protein BioC